MKFLMVYVDNSGIVKVPVGVLYILSHLKEQGHQVSVFDTTKYAIHVEKNDYNTRGVFLNFMPLDLEPYGVTFEKAALEEVDRKLVKQVLEFNPDMIGISIIEDTQESALHFARICKTAAPGVPIIAGGVYCSIRPDAVIGNKCIDMVCVGEGEYTVSRLFDRMRQGKGFSGINNLWVKLPNGEIEKNPMEEPAELDPLPYPDLSLMDDRHLYAPFAGHIYKMSFVESQRGCPRRCTYCCNQIFLNLYSKFGPKYLRRKKIKRLIEELVYLKNKFELNFMQFTDDDFLLRPLDEIKEFSSSYKKWIGLPFWIQAEAHNATDEKIKLIKECGCISISMGIETGSRYILEEIMKRKTSKDVTLRAFETMHKYGIRSSANVILGMPEETRENIFETIEFVRKCKPRSVNSNIFIPYEGTALREYCLSKGYLKPDYQRDSSSWKTVLKMPQITGREIEDLMRTFVLYATLPKKYWKKIEAVEKFPDENVSLQKELEGVFWKIMLKRGINVDVEGIDYGAFYNKRRMELAKRNS